jgi:glycosyltransferase involved in cell wall biosynthesis
MASGLPCLVAAHSGLRDRVRNGVDGFQFEPGNSAQLATLVRWLLSDPSLREELAASALAHARSQTWEANLDGLLGRYERLAAEAGRALAHAV